MSNFRKKYYSSIHLKGVSIISEDVETLITQPKINVLKLIDKVKYDKNIKPKHLRESFLVLLEVIPPYRKTWDFCYQQNRESYSDLLGIVKNHPKDPKLQILSIHKLLDEVLYYRPDTSKKIKTMMELGGRSSPILKKMNDEKHPLHEYIEKNLENYFGMIVESFLTLFEDDIENAFWSFQKSVEIVGQYGNDSYVNRCFWMFRKTQKLLKKANNEKLYNFLNDHSSNGFEKGKIARIICDWICSFFSGFFEGRQVHRLWSCLFSMKKVCVELIPCIVLHVLVDLNVFECGSEEEIVERMRGGKHEVEVNMVIGKSISLLNENKKKYTHFQLV